MFDFTINDLKKIKKIFFIGIGGIGVSALARIMNSRGYEVSGSDLKNSELTKTLESEGIKIFYSQVSENISPDIGLVVKTSIVKENLETIKAKEFNIPILIRGEFLSLISNEYNLIAVAGSHGKTTTSALTTFVLKKLRDDISFNVGGILANFATNSDIKENGIFVTEADESDGSFLNLKPNIALINNLDPEHLDHYGNFENLKLAFKEFCDKSNNVVWNIDDKNLRSILAPSKSHSVLDTESHLEPIGLRVKHGVTNKGLVSFGFSLDAYYRAENIIENNFSTSFDLLIDNKLIKNYTVPLTGKYNVLNTLGVIASIDKLEEINILDLDFSDFRGVKRRSELIYKNKEKNISLYDDYAHHPIEMEALFKNILRKENMVILYQPHKYTRTRDSFDGIVESLKMPDNLIILKEYSAGEKIIKGATALDVFNQLDEKNYNFLKFADTKEDAEKFVTTIYDKDYTIFSVGAGNLNEVLYSLKNKL